MTGLKVEDQVLLTKKALLLPEDTNCPDEVFQALIEDRPTACLCLKNIVQLEELKERLDFKELEFDVRDEMNKYGKVTKVIVPRPPIFSDPHSLPGFGKVFVEFGSSEEASKAKKKLLRRRFNGRIVEVMYFSEEKFKKSIYN